MQNGEHEYTPQPASPMAVLGRRVLEQAPIIVVVLGSDGRVQYVNPFFEVVTGWRLAEACGRYWFSTFLPEHDRERARTAFLQTTAGTSTRGTIQPILTRAGAEREIEWHDQVQRDAAGRVHGVLALGIDVSARVRAEAELRRTHDQLEATLHALPDLAFEVDQHGRIYAFHAKRLELLAVAPEQFMFRRFHDVLPSEAADACLSAITAAARDGFALGSAYRLVMPEGECWFEPVVARKQSAPAEGLRFILLARDVTARVAAEQGRRMKEDELLKLNAELEARVRERTAKLELANRQLETFAYSVSHDLKAPLRSIDGYTQLVLEDCKATLGDDACHMLEKVQAAASQMSELIDELLTYSQLERSGIRSERIELLPLINRLLTERAEEIRERRVVVRLDGVHSAVMADRSGLTMALRNLLENALKFTRACPDPTIEIGELEEAESCVLWLRDNGVGFDMKVHDNMFELFQRFHGGEDYPGTGLGLAIVRKAAERMDGRVWAKSEPGHGATFFLELPR